MGEFHDMKKRMVVAAIVQKLGERIYVKGNVAYLS